MKSKPNIFTGLFLLVSSPSGLFSLITLVFLTIVSLKLKSIVAFAGFCTVIPAILAHTESNETLQTNRINETNKIL